jgi:hypothetical protein
MTDDKFEARNTKLETSTNVQNSNDPNEQKQFRILKFEFVSDFDIRNSDLTSHRLIKPIASSTVHARRR